MTLINDVLSFFMKRRIERINFFRDNPIETQEQVFKDLIWKSRNTEWGRKYDYKSITNLREYQNRVPISNYEELYPYIERVLKGEKNILWPTDIKWFSKSSGTTNARSKYIPVSVESLEGCHYQGGKDMLTLLIENKPETSIFDGKGLSIGGSMHENPFNPDTKVGDISAVMMQNLPTWAEFVRTPPLPIALLDNWEQKMEKMIEICSNENVTNILGVPTWTVVLLERIMEEKGVKNMLEVWPNFENFFHGAVNFQPYRELFKTKFFPSSNVTYLETYNASEGYFGVQDDLSKEGELLLMLDYGVFYEFVPMDQIDEERPKAIHLGEVELGKNYAIILNANSGLWRYKIGDTVKFTSIKPYRIKISGRTKHFINAFGEELIIENADMAITAACKATGISVKDFTAAPVFMSENQKGGHEWIIECIGRPSNTEDFITKLDATLRDVNSDYDAKRTNDMAMLRPIVHFVSHGTFYNWMQKKGKLGGQNKVPRLSNSREHVDDLLRFVNE